MDGYRYIFLFVFHIYGPEPFWNMGHKKKTATHYYKKYVLGRLVTLCRGGLTSRSYRTVSTNYVFVGAVQYRTAPTVRFSAKKIQIYNSKSHCRTSHDQRSEPRSRCRTPRDQRSEPRSRCQTPHDRDYKHKSIL